MSDNLNQWSSVPAGARFSLSVAGQSSTALAFVCSARALPTVGDESTWFDTDLNPGPHTLTTSKGVAYAVRLAVKFLGDDFETAVVKASAVTRGDKQILDWWGEAEYVYEVTGKRGSPIQRMTLLLINE